MARFTEILKLAAFRLLKQSEFLLLHSPKFLFFFLECRLLEFNRTLMPHNKKK